ncbi:MAG: large-conductance mechanosensitive channel protein MscL [Hymenobacteraceae bacterium]|nr:large-conductance mechanosensitive channel protein MscL [Hymenobacteraceae bacterium]MDX5396956.1 large-conductance mechanosensitive channel protein MscL [Hymenobacteraceae bacterium]MDX5443516.1 large-conductance mechanosensitive channel protein MscL [Hymenobacteraceae bacterium]MDX5513030.1 large-conductance mechanosensitive channel protein MscL [Hymenobacteraceae bacterium]
MGLISEFRKFAVKGNLIDLATAVVVGGAFGKITTSLVNDIIMPPLGLLIAGINFENLKWIIRDAKVVNGEVVREAVSINYGAFAQTMLNFIIIAFAIFLMVKTINKIRHREATKPAPALSKEEQLLTEIRDLLKAQHERQ